jgi:hypothetical protein
MARIGGRDVATYDIGVLGAGLVVFISSFLPWYGVKFDRFSHSWSAWHSGFLAWFPILLCLAIAGLVAAQVLGRFRMPPVGPIPPALVFTIASGFALLLIVIRWATLPDVPTYLDSDVKSGARAGLFLGLFAVLALTAFTALRHVSGADQTPAAGPPGYPYGPPQPGWPQGQQPGAPQPGAYQQPPQGGWQQGQQPGQGPGGWQQGQPQGVDPQRGWQQYPPQQGQPQQGQPQGGWQQYPPPQQQGGWSQNPQG